MSNISNLNYSKKEADALRYIRNAIVHDGKSPSVRDIMAILNYKSPHSAMIIVNRFISSGFLRRKPNGDLQLLKEPEDTLYQANTVDIPILGSVPCGLPFLAEENFEGKIPVSTKLAKPPHQYFLLHAIGDSMNKKGIEDGNLILVRQQSYAENGESVVALINDEATVKELHKSDGAIILKPQSTNIEHKPIILTDDFQVQGVVVAALPNI